MVIWTCEASIKILMSKFLIIETDILTRNGIGMKNVYKLQSLYKLLHIICTIFCTWVVQSCTSFAPFFAHVWCKSWCKFALLHHDRCNLHLHHDRCKLHHHLHHYKVQFAPKFAPLYGANLIRICNMKFAPHVYFCRNRRIGAKICTI